MTSWGWIQKIRLMIAMATAANNCENTVDIIRSVDFSQIHLELSSLELQLGKQKFLIT